MKNIFAKTLLVALVATIGISVASPAHADWYDRRHRWHRGPPPAGWVYNAQYGYFYRPVYYAPAPAVIVAQPPPPPPVIVAAPPPAPVYEAAPPVGLSLGVHIR